MTEQTEVAMPETATVNGQPETNLKGSFLKTAKAIIEKEKKKTPTEIKAQPPVAEAPKEIKEEPKVEPAKEAPKATEQKPEEKKEEQPKSEPVTEQPVKKEWYDDDAPILPPTNGQVEKGKTEEIDYRSKYSEVEPILNHPQIKAAIAAVKSGKDIFSLASEIQGVDPSKMTPTQKYEWELKQSGISQAHIDSALEAFSLKEEWEQELQTKPIEAKIIQQRNAKLEEYGVEAAKNEQAQAQFTQRAKDEYIKYVNELTDYNGVEITNERKAKLIEKFEKGVNDLYNTDGSINAKSLVRTMFLDEFEKDLVKVNVRKALNDGRKEVLEKVVRTDGNYTPGNRQTVTDEKPTGESLVEKIIRSRQAARNT